MFKNGASRGPHSFKSHSKKMAALMRRLLAAAPDSVLLTGIKHEDLAKLAEAMTLEQFVADESLMTIGDAAQHFAIVLDGSVKATIPRTERWPGAAAGVGGRLQEWRLMQMGEVVGEMALFSGMVRSASVVALTNGFVGVMRYVDLGRLGDRLAELLCMRLAG